MKILIKIYNWIIKMAKKVLNLDTDSGAESWGSVNADNVVLDTTNFDKNLDTTITDVQKLADAVDELDISSLPTPTANKLLRANGTEWVTTVNSSLTDSNTNVEFKISNNANPTTKYSHTYISDTEADFVVQFADNKGTNIYSNTSYSQCVVKSGANEYIWLYADANNKNLTLKPKNANEQTLSIKTTRDYTATSKILEFYGKFEIYQNGKIVSNYLSGSTNRLLEVTPDGTIQRYTGTMPSAQVNSDWNATSGVAEILNKPNIPTDIPTKIEHLSTSLIGTEYTVSRETLGITGDLRDRIKQMKVWIKNASGGDLRTDSTAGEYIGEDFISVEFNTDLSGNYVKIILYID